MSSEIGRQRGLPSGVTVLHDPHPSQFGVKHEGWRKGQFESVEWCLDPERDEYAFLEVETGGGKTDVVRAIASRKRTNGIVRSKSLQGQYVTLCDFDEIKGKDNYPCVHGKALPGSTAGDCLHSPAKECTRYDECPYISRQPRNVLDMMNAPTL
jgi:hypothetical protein